MIYIKIQIDCPKCIEAYSLYSVNFEICNDGRYELVCTKGHRSAVFLYNEKYEILFEMGASALLDGYKQEAVVCMTTALERFHEWCILILLRKNNVSYEDFEKTWKHIKRQSERQLGAFYFLYLMEFKEPPKGLQENKVSFRNNVIHNGYIPSYGEAKEYGNYVFEYIQTIQEKIHESYTECSKDIAIYKKEQFIKIHGQVERFHGLGTILNLYAFDSKDAGNTFEKGLEYLKLKLNIKL